MHIFPTVFGIQTENKSFIRKSGPSGGWHQWEEGEYEERVKEGKYGESTMYSCMKME
jgi:hypothetical protein